MEILEACMPCHNPYFSRWFSAISQKLIWNGIMQSHNPYFSRWFSAILGGKMDFKLIGLSQSLF